MGKETVTLNWYEKRCDDEFEKVDETFTRGNDLGKNVNIEKEVRLLYGMKLKEFLKKERLAKLNGRPRR